MCIQHAREHHARLLVHEGDRARQLRGRRAAVARAKGNTPAPVAAASSSAKLPMRPRSPTPRAAARAWAPPSGEAQSCDIRAACRRDRESPCRASVPESLLGPRAAARAVKRSKFAHQFRAAVLHHVARGVEPAARASVVRRPRASRMIFRSAIASRFRAIGRKSPWLITWTICSSGPALIQTRGCVEQQAKFPHSKQCRRPPQ